jgi:hypothetical protein
MSENRFTNESLAAIAEVFASLSTKVIKHFPSWDYATVEQQFTLLQTSLATLSSAIGSHHYVLEITQATTAGKPLSAKEILNANTPQYSIIRLGKTLDIVAVQSFTADIPTSVELSDASSQTVLLYREANDAVTVYANGCTAGYFDLKRPHIRPPISSRFARRAEDYEYSILDHYSECVRYGQSTDHWSNKPARILFALKGTSKTEDIFHRDLHLWLEKHLQAQVWRGPKDTTRDELDIIIISPRGRTYLVEIKWIGVNSNHTKYTINDISKGIGQMNTYLTKQTRISKGTLVAYDGRDKVAFDKLLSISDEQTEGCKRLDVCNGVPVSDRGGCIILFLENKTASEQ